MRQNYLNNRLFKWTNVQKNRSNRDITTVPREHETIPSQGDSKRAQSQSRDREKILNTIREKGFTYFNKRARESTL